MGGASGSMPSWANGIDFSNRPGQSETVFGNGFLPLRHPGPLLAGDLVAVDLGRTRRRQVCVALEHVGR